MIHDSTSTPELEPPLSYIINSTTIRKYYLRSIHLTGQASGSDPLDLNGRTTLYSRQWYASRMQHCTNTVQFVSKEKSTTETYCSIWTVTLQDARHKAFINKVIWIKNETLVILFLSVSLRCSQHIHESIRSIAVSFISKIISFCVTATN